MDHASTIDVEVSVVPISRREMEGTTFVSEFVYVSVYAVKTVFVSLFEYSTATNTRGCGDKDTPIAVCYSGAETDVRMVVRGDVVGVCGTNCVVLCVPDCDRLP